MRRGCGGELVNCSVSVWAHFDRHAPTATLMCLQKILPSEGRASRDRECGGGVTSPTSSSSYSPSSEDPGKEVCPLPVPSPPYGQHSRPAFSVSMPATIHCGHGSLPAMLRPQVR
jgi:hypothetical protein